VVVTGEPHGRDHVGGADASGNQARASIDGAVPDGTRRVVVRVLATDQPAAKPVNLHGG
jgi:hypothetical protein